MILISISYVFVFIFNDNSSLTFLSCQEWGLEVFFPIIIAACSLGCKSLLLQLLLFLIFVDFVLDESFLQNK